MAAATFQPAFATRFGAALVDATALFGKASKADRILSLINTLYMIERQIKELSAAEKFQQR
jgi:hypothetical protein